MQLGMIGLGKMGLGLALKLMDKGHAVVGYDISAENTERFMAEGGRVENTIEGIVSSFGDGLKAILLMVPAGKTIDDLLQRLEPFLKKGDIVVDCGNSNYHDTQRRYFELCDKGVCFLDCGTSGGPHGARHGACTMIGGDREAFETLRPVFEDISLPGGCLYVGQTGSGHFVKMIHNGIEYGMMQSIAEGFEILHRSEYDIDLCKLSKLWNNGSVIRGWLMELVHAALSKDSDLSGIRGIVHSSGECKWTVETALDYEIE